MLSKKPLPVKTGDNIPLNGRIEVKEWDPAFENVDGTLANGTIMLNGGEVNYASPPATAGLWPGSPGPYSNVPSLSFDYLYTP